MLARGMPHTVPDPGRLVVLLRHADPGTSPLKPPTRQSARPIGAFSGPAPVWLLDLDNTLHDAMRSTFPGIKLAMGAYIERALTLSPDEAGRLRDHYGARYGATLLGLVRHHAIDPHDFLAGAHPLEHLPGVIRPSLRLRASLRRLPGRRVLLTNAPAAYAARVVRLLGITQWLDEIVTIERMGMGGRLQPKPSRPMFRRVVAAQRVHASRCILVEDSLINLRHARAVGIQGVWVTGFGRPAGGHQRSGRSMSGRRLITQLRTFEQLPRHLHKFRVSQG